MSTAIMLFKQYSGHGLIISLFLVVLLYLYFEEKNKENRSMFVFFPIGILIMFFFPPMMYLMERLSEEAVFWRLLWCMPVVVVIAYGAVVFIRKTEGIKRYVTIFGVVLLIVVSGDYLYDNPGGRKAENMQHIPQDVIDVCDEIIVEGREVIAAFPAECLMYVTQYTPLVHMPYGREMFLVSDGAVAWNALYEIMESEVIDAKELANELRKNYCHFVVLRGDAVLEGSLEKEDWIMYAETNEYIVYMDKNNDPRIW